MAKIPKNDCAVVTVKYKDGRKDVTLPARELRKRETVRAKEVIAELLAGTASATCCGHALRGNGLGPHASALPGDLHTCGWFGLGAHSEGGGTSAADPPGEASGATLPTGEPSEETPGAPSDQPTTTTAECSPAADDKSEFAAPPQPVLVDAEADALQVNLCLGMPVAAVTNPGREDSRGGDSQRAISLAALVTEFLYRTGAHQYMPERETAVGSALESIRDALGSTSINGQPASKVVFVATRADTADRYAEFSSECSPGLATCDGKTVAIVIGEATAMDEGSSSRIWLDGSCPSLTVPQDVLLRAKRSYERAYLRINDPRGARVLVAASVVLESAFAMRALGVGLVLVSDAFMPSDSSWESQFSNKLAELGIAHSKPRNAGKPTEVPDFLTHGVVVEVVGRRDSKYIKRLQIKLERYAVTGKRVVLWLVAFGEQLWEAIGKVVRAIGRSITALRDSIASRFQRKKKVDTDDA